MGARGERGSIEIDRERESARARETERERESARARARASERARERQRERQRERERVSEWWVVESSEGERERREKMLSQTIRLRGASFCADAPVRAEQVRRYVVNAVLTVLWCESALQRPRGASWTHKDN